jgi:hypothetical protein
MSDETPEAAAAVPAPSGINLAAIAGEVSTIDEAAMKFLPFVTTIVGVIPGAQIAAPFLAMAGPLLVALDSAAKQVAEGKPGAAAQDVFQELINHLTTGKPNSPLLS